MKLHRLISIIASLAIIFSMILSVIGIHYITVVGQFSEETFSALRMTGIIHLASAVVIFLMSFLALVASSRYADLLDRNRRRDQ